MTSTKTAGVALPDGDDGDLHGDGGRSTSNFDQFIAAILLRARSILTSLPGANFLSQRLNESAYAHDTFRNESVQPGDIIFTATPGHFFSLGRRLAGIDFDHVVRVVNFDWDFCARNFTKLIYCRPLLRVCTLHPKFFTSDPLKSRVCHFKVT